MRSLFAGLPATFLAPEAHEDHAASASPGAQLLARSAQTPVAAARPGGCSMALGTVRPTPFAERILSNWVGAFIGG